MKYGQAIDGNPPGIVKTIASLHRIEFLADASGAALRQGARFSSIAMGSALLSLVADGGFVEARRAGGVVFEVVLAELVGAAGRPVA